MSETQEYINNSFIGNFGTINKACRDAGVKYIIKKYPDEDKYHLYVGEHPSIEFDLCDDMFEYILGITKSLIEIPKEVLVKEFRG